MQDKKAIIFDMDGLLIDSMAYWLDFDKVWFEERNIAFDDEMIKKFTGKSVLENMKYVKDNFEFVDTVEEMVLERTIWQDEIYKKLSNIMPGVENLLNHLIEKKVRRAIASGAPLVSIDMVVDRFGWRDKFGIFVSADQVNFTGKPDPAIFLYTAEQMGIKPEDCIVLEDAENGVIAAKRAGMACIAVLDKRWSFGDFSEADLIVDSLEDKEIYKFLNLRK